MSIVYDTWSYILDITIFWKIIIKFLLFIHFHLIKDIIDPHNSDTGKIINYFEHNNILKVINYSICHELLGVWNYSKEMFLQTYNTRGGRGGVWVHVKYPFIYHIYKKCASNIMFCSIGYMSTKFDNTRAHFQHWGKYTQPVCLV